MEFDLQRYALCKHMAEELLKEIDFKPIDGEQTTLSVIAELLYQEKIHV